MKPSKLILTKTNDFGKTNTPKANVVMIHGIASDSASYNKALNFFKENGKLRDFRFITFDLLGSGKSFTDDSLEYNYKEQVSALHAAICDLEPKAPMILIGHSLGTFIVTRYTKTYPDEIEKLILISPPIYKVSDFDNPAFWAGIDMFKKAVSVKKPNILEKKAFINSMENIVLCRENYQTLAEIKTPTTLIFGTEDRLIASHNIPGLLRKNKHLKAVPTIGRHGVAKDKFTKIAQILVGEEDEDL